MIIDISDASFKKVLNDEKLFLPIRWDGADFYETLDNLYNYYIKQLEMINTDEGYYGSYINLDIKKIKKVCGLLKRAVKHYLNGFPSKSYRTFKDVMDILMLQPLRIYEKSVLEQFQDDNMNYEDELKLFRAVCVEDNKPYSKTRVFHTPYNLRSKVSTSRYSIAGYPSLYLGTALELCCEEIHMNPHKGFAIASIFKLERNAEYSNAHIQVIELGVKPQDFVRSFNDNQINRRVIKRELLESKIIKAAYLLWYPLIAASSYIRTNKKDPFAAEYIIPQLLMQWVRSEINVKGIEDYDRLIGIRYFSCASVKASDMGFNYVFPTSGQQIPSGLPYCSVLARAFKLTTPIYIHEYEDIWSCEDALRRMRDYDFIGS